MTPRKGDPPPLPDPLPHPVVDAHTHLDACGATDEAGVAAAMKRAAEVGVRQVVTVADDIDAAHWAVRAAGWHPDVYAAVALHPTRTHPDVFDDAAKSTLTELAAHPRVRAIGETGLDYYWDFAPPRDQQRDAFAWHIDLAEKTGKPVMIHDRDAHDDVLDVLAATRPTGTVIFHCFSGDAAMAKLCVDNGWYLSFAGNLTFKNATALAEAAAAIPLEHMLVETDAPFLTAHPFRGRPNEPYLLPYVVRRVAESHGRDLTEVCARLAATAASVYNLPADNTQPPAES